MAGIVDGVFESPAAVSRVADQEGFMGGRQGSDVQERLDSIFDKMQGVQSFDGHSVGVNKYEYRISYLDMIRTLRNNINTAAGDMGI